MLDINMIRPVIQQVFQKSGSSMLSKSQILSHVTQMPQAKSLLPFLQKIPDKNDYTENSLTHEVQNVAQKQPAGGVEEKIRSKVGI